MALMQDYGLVIVVRGIFSHDIYVLILVISGIFIKEYWIFMTSNAEHKHIDKRLQRFILTNFYTNIDELC